MNGKTSGRHIAIREEYCIGCRLCEVHCITRQSRSKVIVNAFKGKDPRPVSGIVFEERGVASIAMQCRHCEDAPCIEACMTNAMRRDPKSGQVLHDKDKCVGCWMCIMVCPFGVIKADVEKHKVASKCDLCLERGFPACVENCPNEAIILLEADGRRVKP